MKVNFFNDEVTREGDDDDEMEPDVRLDANEAADIWRFLSQFDGMGDA